MEARGCCSVKYLALVLFQGIWISARRRPTTQNNDEKSTSYPLLLTLRFLWLARLNRVKTTVGGSGLADSLPIREDV